MEELHLPTYTFAISVRAPAYIWGIIDKPLALCLQDRLLVVDQSMIRDACDNIVPADDTYYLPALFDRDRLYFSEGKNQWNPRIHCYPGSHTVQVIGGFSLDLQPTFCQEWK